MAAPDQFKPFCGRRPGEPRALGDLIETQDRWRLHWSWEAAQFRYQAGGDAPEPELYDPFDPPVAQG